MVSDAFKPINWEAKKASEFQDSPGYVETDPI